MSDRFAQILTGHFMRAIKNPDENVLYAINEKDKSEWHILIRGLLGDGDEFKGGEYIFRVQAPKPNGSKQGFPYEPPEFYAMTPNGVCEMEKKVCINIGSYHAENYPAAMGMAGFCKCLVSMLIGWKDLGHGINLIKTSVEEKINMAKKSIEYNNKNNKDVQKMIMSQYETYSLKWSLQTDNSTNKSSPKPISTDQSTNQLTNQVSPKPISKPTTSFIIDGVEKINLN